MRSIQDLKIIFVLLLLSGIFVSCKYDTQIAKPKDYVKVYMPQAVNSPDVYTLDQLDSIPNIVFGANYGGPDYPSKDIKVTFMVDPSLTEIYNAKNNTDYVPAPTDSYVIDKLSVVIPKGKLSTEPLNLKINTQKLDASHTGYMIPLEIVAVDGARMNQKLSVTYFLITTD